MTSAAANHTVQKKATRREWIGLGVLVLACVLYAMDLTVLHLAVPKLSAALQPTSAQLLWIIDIYGFLVAGSLITMGTLGDRIGRRRLLMIGAAFFGAVSVVAAFSTSAEMLIASRALMGIAGATLAPSTLSLIFNMFRDPKQRSVAIGVLVLACVLYAMDLTVLHLAVPKLSAALQPTSAQLLWIIDIYGFLVAGSLITMGTLGDRIGRRRLLMIGAAFFGAVSVVAALSTSAEMLIASRALMGIAGATLAPSTLSLIFNMFRDPKQRSVAIGVWISAFSAGGAIGPVLGGVLLEYFWWGSVFLLALPVMALLLLLGPRVLPEYRDPEAGRLDLRSAGMSLVAILAVIAGLKQIAQDGFSAPPVLFIAGGLVLAWMFLRRQRGLRDPLIDPKLFRTPTFNVSLATNVLAIFIAVGYFLFIAQYLQLVLELTPLQAGLWSLPSAVGFIIGSNTAPRFIHRFRPALVLGFCLAVGAVGLGLLTLLSGTNGLPIIVGASMLISLSLAPVFSLTTELIVGSAPPEKAGAASGVSETGAELGGALGIAILGSIGTAIYRSRVAAQLPADFPTEAAEAAMDTLGASVGIAATLPQESGSLLLEISRAAFVDGLHLAAAISAVVALGAAVMVLTLLRGVAARPPQEEEFELETAAQAP